MTRTERFAWTIGVLGILALVTVRATAQDRVPPQTTQATDWRALTATPQSVDLASIKPLEVVHYSWPIRPQDVTPPAWWLHDFVRITRGATIAADTGTTEAHVRALAHVAAQYRASVAIVMAPYHHVSWADGDPRKTDATYWPFWRERLTAMKGWVDDESVRNGAAHGVSSVRMVIFDCERFRLKDAAEKDAAEWNAAMKARYDEAYDVAKDVFGPECYVEWYSRGWYRPIGVEAWQRNVGPYYHFDGTEKGDGVSAVVTRPDWTDPSMAAVYETLLRGKATDRLVTWVWLGSGYRYVNGSLGADYNWDYGLEKAAALAKVRREFRERTAAVIFYPSPGSNPHWLRHFAEYAR